MYQEETIIKQCLQGDRQAQSALYQQYSRKMFGVCMRYSRTREDAEDVLHIAFVKVFSNLAQYHFKGSFEGWIRRIMVNASIDYYRNSLKQQWVSMEEMNEGTLEKSLSDSNPQEESEAYSWIQPKEVMRLMQDLPNGYRIILNMYAVDGLNHREISEMLGVSIGTSKSQLSKARRYLKHLIEKKILTKSVDLPAYER